jgi:glycosyltransferase involved in cell wall biosynthesis
MRLVQYFQPKYGYAEYYLLSEFRRQGHEALIVTSDCYYPGNLVFNENSTLRAKTGMSIEYGLTVYRLPSLFTKGDLLISKESLSKVVETFKPDVIHSNDLFYLPTVSAMKLKKRFGYAFFVDSITGTFAPKFWGQSIFQMYKCLFNRYLRKNVTRFFAISEGSREWLIRNLKIPFSSIEFIPLGADSRVFFPDIGSRILYRKKLGIIENEVVLMTSGKFIPEKDTDILLKSVSNLAKLGVNNVKLVLIGGREPVYFEYLQRLIAWNHLKENVIWIPTVDKSELPLYYNAADIAVWPGAPSISIIEAMAVGLPIVIAGYHKLREDAYDTSHLIKNRNGTLFSRGSVEDLTLKLRQLIISADLRREMGKLSRDYVEKELDWSIIARRYLTVYENDVNCL